MNFLDSPPPHSRSSNPAPSAAATPTATPSATPMDTAPAPTAEAASISESDIHSLLAYFWSFNPSTTPRDSPDLVQIHTAVTRLFAKDYDLALVDNDWCSSYPHQLIIPTRQRSPLSPNSISSSLVNNPSTLAPLFRNSRFSRVRSRFVVPVLILNGRNICRSSTLSNEAEVQLNSIAEKAKYLKRQLFSTASTTAVANAASDPPPAPAGRPRSPGASPPPVPPLSVTKSASSTSHPSSDTDDTAETTPPLSTMERQRLADIALLRALQVTDIFDLMVENRKVKAFFTITSSEKADTRNRYAEFAVVPIPYPGVEFFEDFKSRGYCGKELRFDWMQAFADAELKVERAGAWRRRQNLRHPPPHSGTDDRNKANGGLIGEAPPVQVLSNVELWKEWRNWDIIRMTQHYLQLILHSLVAPAPSSPSSLPPSSSSPSSSNRPTSPPALPAEPPATDPAVCAAPCTAPLSGNGGINIHCISGWDRTPAFISWVRLSLWADGLAHQSLCAEEILYLTVAYDWLLFSHLLADRVKNSQEIFAFCFYMLLYILDEREFGVANMVLAEAQADVHGGQPSEPTWDGAKQSRKRTPTLSTSAPTTSITPPLGVDAGHHPESSPTLSDFAAHTPQSPHLTGVAPPHHHHHPLGSPTTRPVDVPSLRRHHLPRRPSNASTASCCTPPLAPSVMHPPSTYSSSSASSMLTTSGLARRTGHGQGQGQGGSPLLLPADDSATPSRSASLSLLAGTRTGHCGDSVSSASAASSLCSVPCQLDASILPGTMVNGRPPVGVPALGTTQGAPPQPACTGSGSVQYSSSWQLISYMQQQLAGTATSASAKRAAPGRPRAPSTGSVGGRGQQQHRHSHSWTLEDEMSRAVGGAMGSVSPAIAPSLGMVMATAPAHGRVTKGPTGRASSSPSSSTSASGLGAPPHASPAVHPVYAHEPHVVMDPTFDDHDADADIDDMDDAEFANARRVTSTATGVAPRKAITPTLLGFGHGPSPALPGATESWSWTVAAKETTPSPVVVPSVSPVPPASVTATHTNHPLSSSSSSSSAPSSRWSFGTSGGLSLAARQADTAGNVNGTRGGSGVSEPQSSSARDAPAAGAHQRHAHERKRTLSISGSWDPNLSPMTTNAHVTGAHAASPGCDNAISRPSSRPTGAWEAKPRQSGEQLVDFAPFSACACCQMPGTAPAAAATLGSPGAGDEEDLFTMDGSLMLVPGPPGCNPSHTEALTSPAHLSLPVTASSAVPASEDLMMTSAHADESRSHSHDDQRDRSGASPPTSSASSPSSSFALLSTTRAQRLLRVRNLFVQAYRPLAQPITAPPLSTKDWPPLPSRPSPAAIAVSAPSLAQPESRTHMGVSPSPPPSAVTPAAAGRVLQPQPMNLAPSGGGGWTSSLSSMMAKMAGVPPAPVTASQPLLSPTSRTNGTSSPPATGPSASSHVPALHAHYMQPLTTLLPTPPMSAGHHASLSSSSSVGPVAPGSAPGVLTMPPSWRSMHQQQQQQQLHRATSPAASAAALSPSAPPSMVVGSGLGPGPGYAHHYMSPLVSPIGGASSPGNGGFRASPTGGGNGSGAATSGATGFRDSWFR